MLYHRGPLLFSLLLSFLLARGANIDTHWGPFGSCLQVFSKLASFILLP